MMRAMGLLVLWATGAIAQPVLIDAPVVNTRHGPVAVVQLGAYERAVTANGQLVQGLKNSRVSIRGAFALQGEAHDWVLVSLSHDGNLCPTTLAVLKLSPGRVTTTAPFGECLGVIQDVRIDPGRISVDLKSGEVAISHVTFSFDGQRLDQTPVAALTSGVTPAGAGDAVTRWIGRHPRAVLEDPGEVARFARILTPADLEALGGSLGPGEAAFASGGWVIGAACMPQACNQQRGLWAIHVATGRAMAAITARGQGTRLFGGGWTDLPLAAVNLLNRPW